jgi:hypothetical protein
MIGTDAEVSRPKPRYFETARDLREQVPGGFNSCRPSV